MGQYWQDIILIFGLILLNAFFAAGEIAVLSSKNVRVRQLVDEGSPSARALIRLTSDHSRFLATIQVGITLAGFLASASAAVGISSGVSSLLSNLGLPASTAHSLAVVIVTIIVAYFSLVLGELVPKRLALQSPERVSLFIARPVELISKLTKPFTSLLTASTNIAVRLLGGDPTRVQEGITEEELRVYVEEHTDLEESEKKLIAGVFDFGDRLLKHVMVPRPDMECLDGTISVRQALHQVRNAGYSAFPVYKDNYDEIIGTVSLRDLLYHLIDRETEDTTVSHVMKPPVFVPDTKWALDLLKEMQTDHLQMVIVVDEYGGVAGLVTLRDLLGEIVGEVGDDDASDGNINKSEHSIDAAETIEDVEDILGVSIPPSPYYQTLAGYIMSALGRVPQVGDSLEIGHWRLTITAMEGLRIDSVKASTTPK